MARRIANHRAYFRRRHGFRNGWVLRTFISSDAALNDVALAFALGVGKVVVGPGISGRFARLEEWIGGKVEGEARANGVGARFGCLFTLLVVSPGLGHKASIGTYWAMVVCAVCVFVTEEIDIAPREDFFGGFARASDRD